ncbi:hypothetical protein IJF85_01485 [Candidatus Saccharibacteria bacterium]|nr:hypothetical protein [Candidatus Saccharibacteria bacterium]
MDFHPVALDTTNNILPTIRYILSLDISPADKKEKLAKVFNLLGSDFYYQMFEANSEVFDSTAIGASDFGEMLDQIERLATKLVRNDALGRPIDGLVDEFFNSVLGNAQSEAYQNAISLDKHPTVRRSMVGETCTWCAGLAGTHIYPDSEVFTRHDNCDCLIEVSGFNSRNGVLNNYRKK